MCILRQVRLAYTLTHTTHTSITIVLSPLRALIRDQVERLRTHYHVPTIDLENALQDEIKGMLVPMLSPGDQSGQTTLLVPAKLALLTPEKLTRNSTIKQELWEHHRAGRISRIAIDEMHYVEGCDQSFRQVETGVVPTGVFVVL